MTKLDTSMLTLVPNAIVPRNWERAFGYEGKSRWISAYWTPFGDEAMCNSDLVAGTANYRPYQRLVKQYKAQITKTLLAMGTCPRQYAGTAIYLLGSSDDPATYHLLLDLHERSIFLAAADVAARFLSSQDQQPKNSTSEGQVVNPDEIFDWLSDAIQSMDEMHSGPFSLCPKCEDGWIQAKDGGYDQCPNNCDGGIIWEEADEHTRKPARQ